MTDAAQCFDVFGFAVFPNGSSSQRYDERDHNFSTETSGNELEKEWHKVMDKWRKYKDSSGLKLNSLVKKGVPANIRASLWKKLLDADSMRENSHFQYQENANAVREELVQLGVTEYNTVRAEEELARVDIAHSHPQLQRARESLLNMRQIFLDVARTFPTHQQFLGETAQAVEGRATLFRILAVYARFNRSVGYCQGMSFIAATLAIHLDEEDAFWCLVALLEKPKFLHGYFDCSLDRVQRHARIFERLLSKRLPDLWSHLLRHQVDPLMYLTPWFMCLFTSLPGWDCVLRIWDIMLLEGVTVVFRTALALMTVLRPTLLAIRDSNVLIQLLQRLPPESISRTKLLPVIFKTNVSLWEITSIQAMLAEETTAAASAVATEQIKSGHMSGGTTTEGAAGVSWKSLRHRLGVPPAGDSGIFKKISGIFAGRKRPLAADYDYNGGPDIIQTSLNCHEDQENVLLKTSPRLSNRQSPDGVPTIGAISSCPKQETRLESKGGDVNGCNASTNEDLNRLQRLRTRRRGQWQSTDSLGKVVDSVVGGVASQRMAFEEFFHQRPLRENQRSEPNLTRLMNATSETELQFLETPATTKSHPAKRARRSHGSRSSLCGILLGSNSPNHSPPPLPVEREDKSIRKSQPGPRFIKRNTNNTLHY